MTNLLALPRKKYEGGEEKKRSNHSTPPAQTFHYTQLFSSFHAFLIAKQLRRQSTHIFPPEFSLYRRLKNLISSQSPFTQKLSFYIPPFPSLPPSPFLPSLIPNPPHAQMLHPRHRAGKARIEIQGHLHMNKIRTSLPHDRVVSLRPSQQPAPQHVRKLLCKGGREGGREGGRVNIIYERASSILSLSPPGTHLDRAPTIIPLAGGGAMVVGRRPGGAEADEKGFLPVAAVT
jgi:hypothetical protein